MQGEKQQPYFFNPGMTVEQLEERLSDISVEIERMSAGGFNGKLSFPWESSSLLRNHQQGSI
ncbi:hypothetical protein BCC21_003881 [Escherichia coli]|nr:hypothetical protein [Escherichia coli]EFI6736486.1 hypothetical protein [Escherichia coli]EGM7107670.1 hypothetical protein [Escherichia coli]EJY7032810.1 hypothetical protein [Escherichia coli]EKD2525724.1 hypothetical protein [Escherichia coli]